MNVIQCELQGVLLIEPKVFGDSRGFFLETWNHQRYRECGIAQEFVQDNVSYSKRGTLRGLHFQNPSAQGKLVSVLDGEIFDVVVDIRRSSPTFGKWLGFELDSKTRRQVYIPPGFAHGFQVVSESVLFHYKCTDLYAPKNEGIIRWNDPDLGIPWPVPSPILSDRDAKAPLLREIAVERLFV